MIDNVVKYVAIDLFSGCGGLSQGMRQAGFDVMAAIEIDRDACVAYRMNHARTVVLEEDIRAISTQDVSNLLGEHRLCLLAGCPPCQGFSSIRRLNRRKSVRDQRNGLILEYLRFVEELEPLTIMMENVPGLADYYLFKKVVKSIRRLGYYVEYAVVDLSGYGVPQKRRRLVLVGSMLGEIHVQEPTRETMTVGDAIGMLEPPSETTDPLHMMVTKHEYSPRISEMISQIPKNGGSRKDLPTKYRLKCHSKANVGFDDVYGRLRWDGCSNTITGGCLNPSKGRFLHPEENRAISAREAALLQTFPANYIFPTNIAKNSLASMIGEALPPRFSRIQCEAIKKHLAEHIG